MAVMLQITMSFTSIFVLCLQLSTGILLNSSYTNNFTITAAESPYFVVSDIEISNPSILFIENGAEIIFNGNYTISVYGGINACYSYNTYSIKNTVGLSDNNTFINIHGDYSQQKIGKILMVREIRAGESYPDGQVSTTKIFNSSAIFCNTHFNNLHYAAATTYSMDNCELSNLEYGSLSYFAWQYFNINTINDTYIHDVNIIKNDNVIYDNCLIQHFASFVPLNDFEQPRNEYYISIQNSKIYGNGTQKCIVIPSSTDYPVNPPMLIYNNIINDCNYGIYVYQIDYHQQINSFVIQNNNITNCKLYGIFNMKYNTQITDNIFENNSNFDIYSLGDNRYKLEIKNNIFINSNGTSIHYNDYLAKNINIRYNRFLNAINGYSLYIEGGQNVNIQNNYFANNNVLGVVHFQTAIPNNLSIQHNIFDSNRIHGQINYFYLIYINAATLSGDKPKTYINNNSFVNNHHVGVLSYCCSNQMTFQHNTMINNEIMDFPFIGRFDVLSIFSNNYILIQHNIFHNNGALNSLHRGNIIGCSCNVTLIQYNDFYEEHNISSFIWIHSEYSFNIIKHNNFNQYGNILYFIGLYEYNNNYVTMNATLNYFKSDDPYFIQTKMFDICNGGAGRIMWWPYYLSKLHIFDSNTTQIQSNTIIDPYSCITSKQPTFIPTTTPTMEPTMEPTTSRIPIETEITTDTITDGGNLPIIIIETDNQSTVIIICLVIALALMCFISIAVVIYLIDKKRKNYQNLSLQMTENIL